MDELPCGGGDPWLLGGGGDCGDAVLGSFCQLLAQVVPKVVYLLLWSCVGWKLWWLIVLESGQ